MNYGDKISYGALIVFAISYFTTPAAALCYAVLIGIFKEVFDWFNSWHYNPDIFEALAIAFGAFLAFIFIYFFAGVK